MMEHKYSIINIGHRPPSQCAMPGCKAPATKLILGVRPNISICEDCLKELHLAYLEHKREQRKQ